MDGLFDVASSVAVNAAPDGRWASSATGKVSELAATARLLALGRKVAVPVVDDDGVDLVVDYRVRVQVKSALAPKTWETVSGYEYSAYRFDSKRGWSNADVFVLHGQDADRWWVVPAAALIGLGRSVSFYEGPGRGRARAIAARYEDAWDVFDV